MTLWIHVAGWTLVHFVWQGAAIALGAAAGLRLLRQASPQARYGIACAALAAMLASPIVTARLLLVSGDALSQPSNVTTLPAIPRAALVTPAPRAAATTTPRSFGMDGVRLDANTWLPALVAIWVAGVAILFLRLAGGWRRVRRMHQASLQATPARCQAAGTQLVARLGLRRAVQLVDSAIVDTPTLVGWLRPVILLPVAALASLTPPQVEAILAHELAHIRRHDYLVNQLQTVVETLLFYHPLVWWVSSRIRVEREHCCDDIAVAVCGDAVGYAAALTELETWRASPLGSAGIVLAATDGSLLARVRRVLLGRGQDRRSSSGIAIATAMLFVMVTFAWALVRLPALHADGTARGDIDLSARPPLHPVLLKKEPPHPPTSSAPPLVRWWTDETEHFDIRAVANIDLVPVGRDVERAYNIVSADLKHELAARPALVIFETGPQLKRYLATAPARESPPEMLLALDAPAGARRMSLLRDVRLVFDREIERSLRDQLRQTTAFTVPTVRVSSIARTTSKARFQRIGFEQPGGFTVTNHSLGELIRWAYQPLPVFGGPAWMDDDRFDLKATVPGESAAWELPVLMRTVLDQQFKVAAHHETRMLPVYALVLARSDGQLGPGLRRSQADCAARAPGGGVTPCGWMDTGIIRQAVAGITMADLAKKMTLVMARTLDRPVIDRTGLQGTFDMNLNFFPPTTDLYARYPALATLLQPLGFPSYSHALEMQLGLKLDPQMAPGDALVIDGAERPGL